MSGYGTDQNAVLRTIAAAANVSCGILPASIASRLAVIAQVRVLCETVNVSARVVDLVNIDPAPGSRYLVGIASDSPELSRLVLPSLIGVGGWALRSFDDGVWSVYDFQLGDGQFLFANGADAVEFFPTDLSGNPMFNPYWFDYHAQFATDGDVSLFQVSINDVDEPGTALLLGASLLALLVSQRKRAKVFSY